MDSQVSPAGAPARPIGARGAAPRERRALNPRNAIVLLATYMALHMTGFVLVQPLFARRFGELGAGVGELGTSTMAYALAGMLAAPFMGALADRVGRRLVVLVSLAAALLASAGYLFAASVPAFIVLRALAGAFTAGLIPAVTGLTADLAPAEQKARWIGIVNGGASAGWIAGPILGGLLYDRWGYASALVVAIGLAVVTLVTAWLTVPETRRALDRPAGSPAAGARSGPSLRAGGLTAAAGALRRTLPASLAVFAMLLGVTFAVMFAWAFIEPAFMFYAYDDLGWSSAMLGLVMGSFGLAFMLGELGLGHLSDRFGRKPLIVAGLALFSAQFLGLAFAPNSALIAAGFVIAGLGNALFDPALNAYLLDVTPAAHQARSLGLKATAGSLGNVLGPGLVVLATPLLAPQAIFLAAAGIVGLSVLVLLSARINPVPPGRSPT